MTLLADDKKRNEDAFDALVGGRHNDPYAILGLHKAGGSRVVRTLQPQAQSVELIDVSGSVLSKMQRVHADGLFCAEMPPRKRSYRLRITTSDGKQKDHEDCYRFAPTLGDLDLYLLGEGSDKNIYSKLGSHPMTISGVRGTRFAVWAPNATRISVIGDFNDWDPAGIRMMRRNGSFRKQLDLPRGECQYKFIVDGRWQPDPEAPKQVPNDMGSVNSVVTL